MTHSTDAEQKRLAELKKEVTRHGFDRYAFHISNASELPSDLQTSAVAVLAAREAIQSIIIVPPQIQRGWHYVPKQALLFTKSGMLHLLASIWPEQEPQVTWLSGCGLMVLKVSLLLLYGYLEFVVQGQHSPIQLGMEFNTVSWESFSDPLRQFINLSRTTYSLPVDRAVYSTNARRELEKLPIKFFNSVKLYGLLPGEELEELVFQKGVWKPSLYFFRQPVTADTLLMLTTNFMVVVQEDLKVKQGWILSYIPRNSISQIQNRRYGLWNELSVQMERQGQAANYKLLLANQTVGAWHLQWIAHGGKWNDFPTRDTL